MDESADGAGEAVSVGLACDAPGIVGDADVEIAGVGVAGGTIAWHPTSATNNTAELNTCAIKGGTEMRLFTLSILDGSQP